MSLSIGFIIGRIFKAPKEIEYMLTLQMTARSQAHIYTFGDPDAKTDVEL